MRRLAFYCMVFLSVAGYFPEAGAEARLVEARPVEACKVADRLVEGCKAAALQAAVPQAALSAALSVDLPEAPRRVAGLPEAGFQQIASQRAGGKQTVAQQAVLRRKKKRLAAPANAADSRTADSRAADSNAADASIAEPPPAGGAGAADAALARNAEVASAADASASAAEKPPSGGAPSLKSPSGPWLNIQPEIQAELKALINEAAKLHAALLGRDQDENALQKQIETIQAKIRLIYIRLPLEKRYQVREHAFRLLSGIEERLEGLKSRGMQESGKKRLFGDMAHLARVYRVKTDADSVFYCPTDRSSWLQSGNRPRNPVSSHLKHCGKKVW